MREQRNFGSPGRDFFSTGWPEQPFLERCGITRIGDLTGLDTVGIPVWFACRPNSRAISVSQGKGLTDVQARISAVMEAVEGAIAEQTTPLIAMTASVADMQARGHSLVPFERLQRCRHDRLDTTAERAWISGRGFFSGDAVHAPYELIGLDMRADAPWDHHAFLMSTIGLAAGPTRRHAALHAMCELIENDATTMVDLMGIAASRAPELDCADAGHPGLREAIATVEAAGMTLRFFDVTGVVPVPTVGCFLQTVFHGGTRPAVGLSAGFACRPHAPDAALAALLEAVQSRLTKIAGSREDLPEATYATGYSALPPASGRPVDIRTLLPPPTTAASDTLDRVMDIIRRSLSVGDVYIFPLTPAETDFQVVRVLVPDFETVVDDGVTRLGSHAIKRLLDMKAGS